MGPNMAISSTSITWTSHVLKTFRTFTNDLEVRARQLWEVEEAVFQGFEVWRQLRANDGGVLRGDLGKREITYLGPAD